MSNIVAFPPPPMLSPPRPPAGGAVAAPAAPPFRHGAVSLAAAQQRIAFAEVATRLGIDHFDPATQVRRLRQLHDLCGMPAPIGRRFWRGQPLFGAANITARSLWDRGHFLAWLDHSCPVGPAGAAPGATDADDSAERAAARARLAHNARRVAGGAA